jgi:hypothetical protein
LAKICAWGKILSSILSIGFGLSLLIVFAGTPQLDQVLQERGLPKTIDQGAIVFVAGLALGLLAKIAGRPNVVREDKQ